MTRSMVKEIARTGAKAIVLLLALLSHDAIAASTWLSSISSGLGEPTSVAVDGKGNVYVTEPGMYGRLLVFDRNENLIHTMVGLQRPIGVAVDGSGNIYVGQWKDEVVRTATGGEERKLIGWVNVYNPDLTLSRQLGSGMGEVAKPGDIAVSASGMTYVTDTGNHLVKVYNPNGTLALTFGGSGNTNGKFTKPFGLALDEAAGELYVVDHQSMPDSGGGMASGARVQVFDLNGTYKRAFGEYGTGPGKMIKPYDITLDASGKVYVTDAFQGIVQVFEGSGAFVETISDPSHKLVLPMGIAAGKDNRLYVASSNGPAVEVFGLPGYTTMDVVPATLTFTAAQGTENPAAQVVTVSNSGTGSLDWSAAAAPGWITVTPANGTAAPSSPVSIGVNITGLSAGMYSGTVTVTAASGAVETITVQLTMTPPPAALSVTPTSMTFKAQQNGSAPPVQTIDIRNLSSGAMTWTAAKSQAWLSLSAASGAAPSQITASVSPGLQVGTYTDTVTIDAPGAQGSPARVSVTVTVVNTGTMTITTNLSQAGFTVTGPAPATTALTGSGALWKNEEMAPGDYIVSFDHVSGYKRPAARSITVTTGNETAIQADYVEKTAATHLVTVTGGPMNKKISVLTVGGEAVSLFRPFAIYTQNVRVASGDLDGSGTDKIAVANDQRRVKVFNADGTNLASFVLPMGFRIASIATGDLDNDGKTEIVLGAVVDRVWRPDIRVIKLLAYGSGKIEEKATLFTEEKNGMFRLAVGDVDGDQNTDVVIADRTGVRAFSAANGGLGQLWSVQGAFAVMPEVAAGDVNDDGTAEIVLSTPGVIQVLKGTGEPTGVLISTPRNAINPASASVAADDVDGDGADELAVGSTGGALSVPKVQMYKGDGTALGAPIEVKNAGGFGANVGLGRF